MVAHHPINISLRTDANLPLKQVGYPIFQPGACFLEVKLLQRLRSSIEAYNWSIEAYN